MAALGLLVSCQRKETRKIERVAILPFENLTADPSLDWIGRAVSRIIAEQLTASVQVHPMEVPDLRGARLSNASRILQGYYSSDGHGLRVRAVERDVASDTNVRWLDASTPVRRAPLEVADRFAKSIDTRTRPFGTQNAAAIQSWGESLRSVDPAEKVRLLERAIASDPNFGAAYIDLAQSYLASGDRNRALDVARRADDRLNQFTDLERARMELVQGSLRGNEVQRRNALVALSRLVSTDVQTIRTLAEVEHNARRFGAAVELYRNALALEPDNASLLNQLGYAEAYNGDLDAARTALERYREIDPKGFNPLDSLGEVHFMAGRFADAEKYFLEARATQAGPVGATESLKAAQARYMQGNLPGADELYGQFENFLRTGNDPAVVALRRAQWQYITGRQSQAMAAVEAFVRNASGDAAGYAEAQLGLWKLDAGDRTRAGELASAAANARNPGVQQLASLLQFMVAGGGESAPPLAQAYGALFTGDYPRAATVLHPLYERTSPTADGQIRTLYAWALAESGKKDEARNLVARYYIPLGAGGDPFFTSQAFPRFVQLRASLVK